MTKIWNSNHNFMEQDKDFSNFVDIFEEFINYYRFCMHYYVFEKIKDAIPLLSILMLLDGKDNISVSKINASLVFDLCHKIKALVHHDHRGRPPTSHCRRSYIGKFLVPFIFPMWNLMLLHELKGKCEFSSSLPITNYSKR